MNWEQIAVLALGYVGQFFKARREIPTWATQAVLAAIGIAFYFGIERPSGDVNSWLAWVSGALQWALSAIGAASLAAGVGAAPKTDSYNAKA